MSFKSFPIWGGKNSGGSTSWSTFDSAQDPGQFGAVRIPVVLPAGALSILTIKKHRPKNGGVWLCMLKIL